MYIKKAYTGTLLFKYLIANESWKDRSANKYIFLKKYIWPDVATYFERIESDYYKDFYFSQIYLVLFFKFLNFNLFNIRIQNLY